MRTFSKSATKLQKIFHARKYFIKKVQKNAFFFATCNYSYEFSCVYQKFVVLLSAFSMVGQYVHAREAVLLTLIV